MHAASQRGGAQPGRKGAHHSTRPNLSRPWVSPYENRTQPDSVMARIFASINRAAGIHCHHGGNGGDGDFRLSIDSSRGVDAIIDRYNIVGHRKRDMIHRPQTHTYQ